MVSEITSLYINFGRNCISELQELSDALSFPLEPYYRPGVPFQANSRCCAKVSVCAGTVQRYEDDFTSGRTVHGRNFVLFTFLAVFFLFGQVCVVISQTHWFVSQERLSPRAGTSVFIDLIPIMPSGERWF